jgi:hypothetical protein
MILPIFLRPPHNNSLLYIRLIMHFRPSTAALEERANAPMANVDTLPEIAFRVCVP